MSSSDGSVIRAASGGIGTAAKAGAISGVCGTLGRKVSTVCSTVGPTGDSKTDSIVRIELTERFVVHFLRFRFRRSAISAAREPSASAVTAAIFQIALDELTLSLPRKKYETSIKSTAPLSHPEVSSP